MKVRRILRNTVLTFVGLIVVLVVTVGLTLLLGLNVNLNALRAPIADVASDALGRQFRIDGDVSVEASLWPTLRVESVRVDNAEGYTEAEFASLDKLSLQLGVLPLLKGRIHVRELVAVGVEVNLESDVRGNNNWRFGTGDGAEGAEETGQIPAADPAGGDGSGLTFEVDTLSFTGISANYVDGALDKKLQLDIAKFNGSVGMETPLELDIEGGVQDLPFSLDIAGPSLNELTDPNTVSPITISGEIVGIPVDIGAEFGYEDAEPRLGFGLGLGAIDVGGLVAWLGVAEGLDLTTEKFSAGVVLRGDSLDELARHSEFSAKLAGGHWQIGDPQGEEATRIKIEKGNIGFGPGKPLTFGVNGVMDHTPVSIQTTGAPLIDYIKGDRALPIKFGVDFADVRLDLSGNVTVPIRQGPFDMDLKLRGENLTTFNETLGFDLPPLGPYRVEGRYAADDAGFKLTDSVLVVGESELHGNLDVDTSQTPPRLDVALTTPRLQLNDFNFEGWSAEGGEVVEPKADAVAVEREETIGEDDEPPVKTHSLLSAEALNSVNAKFDLNVNEVLSGEDRIGQGRLSIAIEDGRLTVKPLHMSVPGGSVDLEFGYEPVVDGVELTLKTLVDRFDYGILARRINPDTKMGGKVFLDVGLNAKAESIGGLMETGRGHFDFALLPVAFDASIFDLWAVNLLSALSKKVDDAPESVINCILARFTLEEGLMQDRVIFMDTTQMSVLGKAEIDFTQHTLGIYVKPEAKRPEFFSVAIPVGVSGKFEDWGLDIGIVPAAWAGVSFVTSPLHVPIRRLFGGDKPLEGEAACRQAWLESEKPPEEPKLPKTKAFQ